MVNPQAIGVLNKVQRNMINEGRTAHLGIDPNGKIFKGPNGKPWMVERKVFDPANPEHKKAYIEFLKTGKWNGRMFYVEWPATSVIRTIERKLINFALGEEVYESVLSAD